MTDTAADVTLCNPARSTEATDTPLAVRLAAVIIPEADSDPADTVPVAVSEAAVTAWPTDSEAIICAAPITVKAPPAERLLADTRPVTATALAVRLPDSDNEVLTSVVTTALLAVSVPPVDSAEAKTFETNKLLAVSGPVDTDAPVIPPAVV